MSLHVGNLCGVYALHMRYTNPSIVVAMLNDKLNINDKLNNVKSIVMC